MVHGLCDKSTALSMGDEGWRFFFLLCFRVWGFGLRLLSFLGFRVCRLGFRILSFDH